MLPDNDSEIPDDLRLWGKHNMDFLYLGMKIAELEKLEKELKMQRSTGKHFAPDAPCPAVPLVASRNFALYMHGMKAACTEVHRFVP